MTERVRVHVASFNTKAATELCIRSLVRYAGRPIELVVGDSGSTDGSAELLRDLEAEYGFELELARERREHWQWLDYWLATCPARCAVFVDSDVEFRRDGWLLELVRTWEETRAAFVCGELLAETANFVEPVGRKTVRLAGRPAPWLLLADVEQVRPLGMGFAFAAVETDDVPEGLIAFDVGARLHHAAASRGLETVVMPRRYRRFWRHYGGLSWLDVGGRRGLKLRRDAQLVARRVRRVRALEAKARPS